MNLTLLPGPLAVCRLDPQAEIPSWAWSGPLQSVTRTAAELSVVCAAEQVPEAVPCEKPWRALVVDGPLEFSLCGILCGLLGPLAAGRISVFALSTFDTDYLLVKEDRLEAAIIALEAAGHQVRRAAE